MSGELDNMCALVAIVMAQAVGVDRGRKPRGEWGGQRIDWIGSSPEKRLNPSVCPFSSAMTLPVLASHTRASGRHSQ